CLLVVIDGCRDVTTAHEQIADTVVERHVGLIDVFAQPIENLRVRLECLVELLLLLVLERSFLELRDVRHQRVVGSVCEAASLRAPAWRRPRKLPVSCAGDKVWLTPSTTDCCAARRVTGTRAVGEAPVPYAITSRTLAIVSGAC